VPGPAAARRLGQHFLASSHIAQRVVADAQIRTDECVVDVGAGTGTLTSALASCAARVVAIEFDPVLARALARRMAPQPNVLVLHGDALTAALPAAPYRVVANPPFAITSGLLRLLLDDPESSLTRADLIVQWQVARARVRAAQGPPGDLLAAAWAPWWEFARGRRLPAASFSPRPNVDAAVLTVTRRAEPLLPPHIADAYAARVREAFTRDGAQARARSTAEWIDDARRSLLGHDSDGARRNARSAHRSARRVRRQRR
jgi:23S rRNA (adenine-N6)-dimethyltransferase